MTIAFFGGTFNPPHNAHLAIALLLRELFLPDKIILSVSRNPLKPDADISDDDRLAMTKLLADEINATGEIAEVSDWELRRDAPSYAIETITHLEQVYPRARWLWAIGDDNFRTFSQWKRYDEILRRVELVVFGRPNSNAPADFAPPEGAKIHRVPLAMNVASTELRQKLSQGIYPRSEMPELILTYVKTRGLYRNA
ncbi:MAG: nicotinate (nicotinamide) nucleotide adenylyltransferase [Chloroherpetonaceae bacterium]|nr:nicotinate (nicotinamide) nucleotide adenylyltransferase [Chloroherpetonaceae bacterium]MDW8438161.1 nicotinate (nicotinamide) nucleotide adenylyltransferase [Chloroherpetonaceae bacterium]